MLKSMTGYGRSLQSEGGYSFTIEMKAVNHRYKEVVFRMPKDLMVMEERLKRKINEHIHRGRIDVFITMEKQEQKEEVVTINSSMLTGYLHAIQKVQEQIPELQGEMTVKELLLIPDIISITKQQIDMDEIMIPLEKALDQALMELVSFRRYEGEQLGKDCSNRLKFIEEQCIKIGESAHEVLMEYHDKLTKRVQEFLKDDSKIDEARIATEIAIYADKATIDEELTRLQSHIKQFYKFLNEADTVVGRKLDFLVQEMNREVNTIGSKSNSSLISNNIVEIKSELEKIREQVQNIE